MQRIHKLPFILGGVAAMIVGIASYLTDCDNQTIFIRMAVIMTIFFIIGVYVRNTILSIKDEVTEKEIENARLEELNSKQEKEKQLEEMEAAKRQQKQQVQEHKVDLVAEDGMDEFEPLTVSRVISTKVKE